MNEKTGQISIVRDDIDETHGRFLASVAGKDGEAKLTFTYNDDLVIADHTGAPENLRGTGVALALVEALIEAMRDEGRKIVPQCSYVAVQFRRHPEWSDVLAK